MDSQIQALTDKVYQEGVLKGEQQAKQIIASAEAEALKLEEQARAQAKRIVAEAERQATELRANTERELQLSASKIIEASRASIVELISGKIASESVSAIQAKPELIQQVVLEIAQRFDLKQGVEISTAQAETLEAYFAQRAKALLSEGLSIKAVAGKDVPYTISPKDGAFKVEVSEQAFAELFKSLLRPQLAQQLF